MHRCAASTTRHFIPLRKKSADRRDAKWICAGLPRAGVLAAAVAERVTCRRRSSCTRSVAGAFRILLETGLDRAGWNWKLPKGADRGLRCAGLLRRLKGSRTRLNDDFGSGYSSLTIARRSLRQIRSTRFVMNLGRNPIRRHRPAVIGLASLEMSIVARASKPRSSSPSSRQGCNAVRALHRKQARSCNTRTGRP